TPLRDGMNLVAKEYIASKEESKNGVLILSEMAGASNELHDALIVNPQDTNEMVEALREALEMDPEDQKERHMKMQDRLKKYTVENWAENFLNEQIKIMEERKGRHAKVLTEEEKQELIQRFSDSTKRLIVLDYDGTLMNFHPDPTAVVPDDELLNLLTTLHQMPENKVVVSSGRDKATLEEWLGHVGLDFAAEHGVWLKKDSKWRISAGLGNSWKNQIRSVLEGIVERTPGSFIEEKEFSVAWHYRKTDKDLGEKRVREFRDVLLYLTSNLDLQVLEGNKVVEIKNAGVNKGKAIVNWLTEENYDFIMAIGDDHTDEDTFKALPSEAYTIKVGMANTAARFKLVSVEDVRDLLTKMIS
ncbi:MAG: trehalose-phosphatase, partial [Phaeodactylibacter sp.]|nr:trehalose-phosphatase [Phaeodactylibacter sp.]